MKAKPKIKITSTLEKYRNGKLYEVIVKDHSISILPDAPESSLDAPGSARTSDFDLAIDSLRKKEETKWQPSQTPE